MPWNAEATVQLIGVLISILGIGVACYNHKRIMAASRWLFGTSPALNSVGEELKFTWCSKSLSLTTRGVY
jgi:hypothetical protein